MKIARTNSYSFGNEQYTLMTLRCSLISDAVYQKLTNCVYSGHQAFFNFLQEHRTMQAIWQDVLVSRCLCPTHLHHGLQAQLYNSFSLYKTAASNLQPIYSPTCTVYCFQYLNIETAILLKLADFQYLGVSCKPMHM